MIEISTIVTPTQRLVLRAVGDWGLATKAVLFVDGEDYADEVELQEGQPCVLKIGQFRANSTVPYVFETRDADDEMVYRSQSAVEIAPVGSPAVIVRQAVFDALERVGVANAYLLNDGFRCPASVAEGLSFTGSSVVVEVGHPSSRKAKKTQVRSEVLCEVPITVYVMSHATAQGYVLADNACWEAQQIVDDTKNLSLVGLANVAANDFAWFWTVQPPELVEVDGGTIPVVVQEMTLQVPVIWVSAPAA